MFRPAIQAVVPVVPVDPASPETLGEGKRKFWRFVETELFWRFVETELKEWLESRRKS